MCLVHQELKVFQFCHMLQKHRTMLSISKFGKDATNKIIDDKWDTCGGGIRSMYYLTDTK